MATGTVTAPWQGECRRCGGPVEGTVTATVREQYAPAGAAGQDEDTYPLTGDELDLEPLARDAVMLDLPLAPLCSAGLPRALPPMRGELERHQVRLPSGGRSPLVGTRRPTRSGGWQFGLGCHPYGRTEEEDVQVEKPKSPGIQLGAEGAGALGVPPVHGGQDPSCCLPELRLVQRPAGDRSRVVARGGPRPVGEAFAALPVAVDAMGGDRAPGEIVAGARQVAETTDINVALVGRPGEMGDVGDLPCFPASEVIGMDDDPGNAVRRKKDSSLVRAAEAVRDGKAMGMVSAGNTGAAMASALLRMGRLPGVIRPAIATPIPFPGGPWPTVLLDSGANAECSPAMLVQFAQMGAAFAQRRYGIERPRVALLSIGEEKSKGSPLEKEAHTLLATAWGDRDSTSWATSKVGTSSRGRPTSSSPTGSPATWRSRRWRGRCDSSSARSPRYWGARTSKRLLTPSIRTCSHWPPRSTPRTPAAPCCSA